MDERRLRKFFHFTEADLSANRRGQFSEHQKRRLSEQAKKEQKSAWESAALLFVVAAAGMTVGLSIGFIAPTLTGRMVMLLLMGILWPSAWVSKGIQIVRAANRLQEPRLREVSGRVQVARHGEGELTIQVDGLEFDVEGNLSGVIMEDDEYRIYYLEATAEILSVDDLRGGKE